MSARVPVLLAVILALAPGIFGNPGAEADATFVLWGNQSSNSSMAATEIFLELARHLYPDRFP